MEIHPIEIDKGSIYTLEVYAHNETDFNPDTDAFDMKGNTYRLIGLKGKPMTLIGGSGTMWRINTSRSHAMSVNRAYTTATGLKRQLHTRRGKK